MTHEEFDALVRDLESRASKKPVAFKWSTALWAVGGFLYLGLVFALALALTIGLVALVVAYPNIATIKLAFVLGIASAGMSWAILRGLFVRLDAPQGLPLVRSEVPALFGAIDELRHKLAAPHFHHVLLTDEHNAGVVQVPRLGLFGWYCNYLILGLPLMQGVSVDEFRAILAHEFAHLSGDHGKFGTWIYRLRRAWQQIFEQLARQKQNAGRVLGKFISWYWPRFNARAFVLSRAQEYEADATAAKLVSGEALATGLIRSQVQGRWLEEKFWPEIYEQVKLRPAPPKAIFTRLGGSLATVSSVPDAARWLVQAFNFQTNNADTHPSLRDRVKALPGLPPDLTAATPPGALPSWNGPDSATALLGERVSQLAAVLDEKWLLAVEPIWKHRHEESLRLSSELEKAEQSGEETVDALWARTAILLERDGDEAAQPSIERILALDEKHAAANFVRGRFLLQKDDEHGLAFVERAMEQDPFSTGLGLDLIAAFYSRNGMGDRIPELTRRLDRHEAVLAKANEERSTVTEKDTLLPADLSPEQRNALIALCQAHPEIASLHVSRKQVVLFHQRPLWLLAVTVQVPWWKPWLDSAKRKLIDQLVEGVTLPGNFIVFIDEKNLNRLAAKVRDCAASHVYEKSRDGSRPVPAAAAAAAPGKRAWWESTADEA